jgi:hypothetical protein
MKPIGIDDYRTKVTGLRHYSVGELSLPSVTSLISKFEDKEALFAEWRAKNPNSNASARGTALHKAVEDYYKKGVVSNNPLFQTILPVVQRFIPSYIEESVYWKNDLQFGFAGTADLLAYTNISSFKEKTTGVVLAGAIEPVIVDFKTWSKAKYTKGKRGDGEYYYPLIRYFLQLAAYRAAFAYSKGVFVNHAFIIGCVENSKTPYIYHLNGFGLNYHLYYIEKMVDCFFKQKPFDWQDMEKTLADSPDNLLGTRAEIVS